MIQNAAPPPLSRIEVGDGAPRLRIDDESAKKRGCDAEVEVQAGEQFDEPAVRYYEPRE